MPSRKTHRHHHHKKRQHTRRNRRRSMRRRGGVSPCGQIQNEFNAIRANFNAVNADNIIDIYGNAKSLYRRAQAAYCNEAVLNEMTNFIDTELHQKMEELLG